MGHDNVARPLNNEGDIPQEAQKGRQQGRTELSLYKGWLG
jgi:hypothetical protein